MTSAGAHGDRFTVQVRDASDAEGWRRASEGAADRPCVILGFEVLDNLPHDKRVRAPHTALHCTLCLPQRFVLLSLCLYTLYESELD